MSGPSSALLAELEAKSSNLSRRCTSAMYADPFWMARFGERGRYHAERDSEYHVKYVLAALRAGDSTLFGSYARWLRGVLVSRGMCSWHLAQSFRQLAYAVGEEGISHAEPALRVLDSGIGALVYDTGPAAPRAARADGLEEMRVQLGADAYRLEELSSFSLDALDRGAPEVFRVHVEFLRQTLACGEPARAQLSRTLDALASPRHRQQTAW